MKWPAIADIFRFQIKRISQPRQWLHRISAAREMCLKYAVRRQHRLHFAVTWRLLQDISLERNDYTLKPTLLC